MGRACSTNGEKRNAYMILVGKPEGKRALGAQKPRMIVLMKGSSKLPDQTRETV
jgi:hypothetical protein